ECKHDHSGKSTFPQEVEKDVGCPAEGPGRADESVLGQAKEGSRKEDLMHILNGGAANGTRQHQRTTGAKGTRLHMEKAHASVVQQATVIPVPSPAQPIPTPAPNPPPSGPVLKLLRYESLPYRVGEPLKVRMFLNNTGPGSITLFGGTHSAFVEKVPDDYGE